MKLKITDITEIKKVDMSEVVCSACNGPATLNYKGLCTHCIIRPRASRVSGSTIWERFTNWLRSGDAEPLTTIK